MVGVDTADDAAVYRLTDTTALVQTIDYFTPVVDDPFVFGEIAAANSLSDIYAMGAKPIIALNIIGFPVKKLSLDIMVEILKGGCSKAKEAGISIIGGHTIDDIELKYGLSVTGLVHPDKVITNAKAKAGDALILTKPLGIGIATTAIKRDIISKNMLEQVIEVMVTLNDKAAMAMIDADVHACTDITGFGLLGHLYEMVSASKLGAEIYYNNIPLISKVTDMARNDIIPGGTKKNLEFIEKNIIWGKKFEIFEKLILADAQTSGGLLIAVPAGNKEKLINSLKQKGVSTRAEIGFIVDEPEQKIIVK